MIDRAPWKITLPIGPVGSPTEIKRPIFDTYEDEWFWEDEAGHFHMRVRADGVTTAGSTYPRTELREMKLPDGLTNAAWATNVGKHTLWMRARVRAIPPVKPDMSVMQIHTGSDDLCQAMFRGKGTPNGLVWRWKGTTQTKALITPLAVDEWFNLKVHVEVVNGVARVKTYADKDATMDFAGASKLHDMAPGSISSCYWKAGPYLQTNVAKGEDPAAEGVLEISHLQIAHT